MVRKRLHHELPIFFTYAIFQVVRTLALLSIHFYGTREGYFYSYWVVESISTVLMFFVIYEVYRFVFRGYEGLQGLSSVLFQWAFGVLFLLAILSAATTPSSTSGQVIDGILTVETSVRIMQCGLAAFLLIFTSSLHLTPKHFVWGLSIGFGLLSFIEIAITYSRSLLGNAGNQMYEILKPGAYLITTGVWFIYLLQPEPVYMPRRINFDESILDRWNNALIVVLIWVIIGLALYIVVRGSHSSLQSIDELEQLTVPVDIEAFSYLMSQELSNYISAKLKREDQQRAIKMKNRTAISYVLIIASNAALIIRATDIAKRSTDLSVQGKARSLQVLAIKLRVHSLITLFKLYLGRLLPISTNWSNLIYEYSKIRDSVQHLCLTMRSKQTSAILGAL